MYRNGLASVLTVK